MDGPDLSHLLDDASSEKPSRDVLDGIVRRRRRLQARRARTAATLGLVILLAGAGVGIGLSRQGGRTMSALPLQTAKLPSMSKNTSAAVPFLAGPGGAPAGLGWVSAGSGAKYSTNVVSPSPETTQGEQDSGQLQVTSTVSGSGTSLCGMWNCSLYSVNGSIGGVLLHHQFTRTSSGVIVRAFTAVWAVAPIEPSRQHRVPPPRLPWSPWRPALSRAPRFPRFPRGAAGGLCRDPSPCCRGV